MAVDFSAKVGFFRLVHDHELSIHNIHPNKRDDRNLGAKLAFQADRKGKRVFRSRLSESRADYEVLGKTRVQELVDQLHYCARKGLLTETKLIHGYVLKSSFGDDNLLILLNHVMHAYLKCSDFSSSKRVLDNLLYKNVFSWSVMIVGLNQQEIYQDGWNCFCKMIDQELLPDGFAYSAVLQSCIGMNCVDLGKEVHAQIIIRGFGYNVVVNTTLLNMYVKLGKVMEAYRVFNTMAEHNDVSWNAMISGLTANGLHLEAYDHFTKMKEQGFVPNKYTLVSVLKAVGMLYDAGKGKKVHSSVLELGLEDNIHVGTALIDMFSKCGDSKKAMSVFDKHFAHCRVNAPWNAMISGFSLSKCSQEALNLYVKMCENNIKSDLYTYCSVFDSIANLRSLSFAKQVHSLVLKSGYDLVNPSVENSILDAYSKCGAFEDGKKIFHKMQCRDIVSWTTLVTAYSQSSKWEGALSIFSKMRVQGFTPNHFTLASVLTACANLCYLEYGRQVHCFIFKIGCQNIRFIESALVDMYAKGGSIGEAEKVFDKIISPDVVSLTAVISGYAYHGLVAHALWHFKRMESMGIKPSSITLLCVLSACSHAGLVEEGLHYFWSMERNYGLTPEMEHYACVVDLLGRVGLLNEALEFIMKMSVEPNEMVWESLLAACRIHGNIKLGEIAAKKIISICPEYSSSYVLLANTYMETGSLKEGVDLRKGMKRKGVRKEPGHSWISVDGRVYTFYAGGTNHSQKDDIYAKLEELRENMNNSDYVPELRYALYG